MNRSAWQFDLLPELGELASQLAHPLHDRLAAGSEPAACEVDRVTQLAEGSVVVEGFGRTGLPDCFERTVKASELLEEADVRVLVRPWLDVIDELLKLSPTTSDPQEVAAGDRNRSSDADLRPLEPLPQAPQSRDPAAADPGPMNPDDNRRLSAYPQVEVERTADVCPSGPARDAVDQGRDGRIIWAGPRSEPAWQGRGRGRSFDSGHGNGPPAYPTKGPPGELTSSSTRVDRATHVPFQGRSRTRPTRLLARRSAAHICRSAPPDTLRTFGGPAFTHDA
jgi:hypothetical protein